MARVDAAAKLISAPATRLYLAFSQPGAMERWLPPEGMTGEMLEFDFREGGHYRMRLRYKEPQHTPGKTSADTDEVCVKITKLVANELIVQSVAFESNDVQFAGEMTIRWSFTPTEGGTLVEVRCENVPAGVRPEDHEAGLTSTLRNLAAFTQAGEPPC
jgi:uncharacterized protein YndB with AHSA1/START domain